MVKKYDLDGDDGGGGNTDLYSPRELHYAKKRFWELSDKIYENEERDRHKASQHATDKIMKKYGQVGMDEMKFYRKTSGWLKAGALIAAMGGLIYVGIKNDLQAPIFF